MNDTVSYLLGIIIMFIGLGIAFTGEAMGQGADNYFIGLASYAGGFIIAFIGVGVLVKTYQKNR